MGLEQANTFNLRYLVLFLLVQTLVRAFIHLHNVAFFQCILVLAVFHEHFGLDISGLLIGLILDEP